MKRTINREGQTVIETALLMILILVLFFGIAEIARAWWYKSQLSNAARVGARVAVVTSTLAGGTCAWGGNCSSGGAIAGPACQSITSSDLCNSATVAVSGAATPGGSVTVTVTGTFTSVVPGLQALSNNLIPGGGLTARMIMRHE